MIGSFEFFSRLLVFAAVAALAGCAGGTGSADLAPAAPQQAAPQVEPSQPSPQAARSPAPAGRSPQSAAPPAPPPQHASSPEEIKAQCWMKFENDKRIKNIDARLALVEKCIDETSRAQPPAR